MNQTISDTLSYGFFFGLSILALFYSLIFFIRLKEKTFLFYSLYVFSLIIFAVVQWGFLLEPLSYTNLKWVNDFYTIPYSMMTIFLLLYARSFLEIKTFLPIYNKILIGAVLLRIAIYFIGLLTMNLIFYSPNVDTFLLLIAYIATFVRLRQGYKPARYLVLAFTVLFAGFAIHSFQYLMATKTFPPVITVYKTGMLEIILFSKSM